MSLAHRVFIFSQSRGGGRASGDRRASTGETSARSANAAANTSTSEVLRLPRMIGATPQEDVLAQLRSNDLAIAERALDMMYRAFFKPLWRVAYRTVHSPDVAEEMVQDVFLGIWQERQTLQVRESVSLYLHVAIRHRAYNYLRHAKVVERYEVGEDEASALSLVLPTRLSDPATALAESETDRSLLAALAGLSERDRDILVLRWREGWSFEEIGRVQGISSVAARLVVSRQQRRLRTFLERLRDDLQER